MVLSSFVRPVDPDALIALADRPKTGVHRPSAWPHLRARSPRPARSRSQSPTIRPIPPVSQWDRVYPIAVAEGGERRARRTFARIFPEYAIVYNTTWIPGYIFLVLEAGQALPDDVAAVLIQHRIGTIQRNSLDPKHYETLLAPRSIR